MTLRAWACVLTRVFVCVCPSGSLATACRDPGIPMNGSRNGEGREPGDAVTFSCDPGYELQGESRITCIQVENRYYWQPSPPSCIGESEGDSRSRREGGSCRGPVEKSWWTEQAGMRVVLLAFWSWTCSALPLTSKWMLKKNQIWSGAFDSLPYYVEASTSGVLEGLTTHFLIRA